MFEITENELIKRMKCRYKDEHGNEAVLMRQPEQKKVILKIKSPFSIRFTPIVINTEDWGDGCKLDYVFDKDDENINDAYIASTVKNITDLMNHIQGLEGAIKLLGVQPNAIASYIGLSNECSADEKMLAVSKAKYNLIAQYDELMQAFNGLDIKA